MCKCAKCDNANSRFEKLLVPGGSPPLDITPLWGGHIEPSRLSPKGLQASQTRAGLAWAGQGRAERGNQKQFFLFFFALSR
jgi:hypothetical protein